MFQFSTSFNFVFSGQDPIILKAFPYHRTCDLDGEKIDVLDVDDITCTYCWRWSHGQIFNDIFSDLTCPSPIEIKYKPLTRRTTKYASQKRSTAERPVTTNELERQHSKRQRTLNAHYPFGGRYWQNPFSTTDDQVHVSDILTQMVQYENSD